MASHNSHKINLGSGWALLPFFKTIAQGNFIFGHEWLTITSMFFIYHSNPSKLRKSDSEQLWRKPVPHDSSQWEEKIVHLQPRRVAASKWIKPQTNESEPRADPSGTGILTQDLLGSLSCLNYPATLRSQKSQLGPISLIENSETLGWSCLVLDTPTLPDPPQV